MSLRLDENDPVVKGLVKRGRIHGLRPENAPRDTPLTSMQALGRIKDDPLNKTERAWAEFLKLADDVLWYKAKPFNLRLADRTFYRVDFLVMKDDLSLEVHEVKGHWTDDALVKIKVAAEQFPVFKFISVSRDKNSQWKKRTF